MSTKTDELINLTRNIDWEQTCFTKAIHFSYNQITLKHNISNRILEHFK